MLVDASSPTSTSSLNTSLAASHVHSVCESLSKIPSLCTLIVSLGDPDQLPVMVRVCRELTTSLSSLLDLLPRDATCARYPLGDLLVQFDRTSQLASMVMDGAQASLVDSADQEDVLEACLRVDAAVGELLLPVIDRIAGGISSSSAAAQLREALMALQTRLMIMSATVGMLAGLSHAADARDTVTAAVKAFGDALAALNVAAGQAAGANAAARSQLQLQVSTMEDLKDRLLRAVARLKAVSEDGAAAGNNNSEAAAGQGAASPVERLIMAANELHAVAAAQRQDPTTPLMLLKEVSEMEGAIQGQAAKCVVQY